MAKTDLTNQRQVFVEEYVRAHLSPKVTEETGEAVAARIYRGKA